MTFWHGDMFWVILASAGLFRCPPFAGEGGALDALADSRTNGHMSGNE